MKFKYDHEEEGVYVEAESSIVGSSFYISAEDLSRLFKCLANDRIKEQLKENQHISEFLSSICQIKVCDKCEGRGHIEIQKSKKRFRKKPVVIEAVQWFKNGDHPEDACYYIDDKSPDRYLSEGKVVRYFRHPTFSGDDICPVCFMPYSKHGWIDTLEDGHRVCPGNWIITGVAGEKYPCKHTIFEETYEPAI